MLTKHVSFMVQKIDNKNIVFTIKNKAPHDLFLHPLRSSYIAFSLERNHEIIHQFETIEMERILEDNDGIAGCTNATKETKNNLIHGNEEASIGLTYDFKAEDILVVEYGYQLVKDQFLKVLDLENNLEAGETKIYKKEKILITNNTLNQ